MPRLTLTLTLPLPLTLTLTLTLPLTRRAREFNSCLPPEAGLKVRGAHCSSPPAYKFLNSGLYAGRAGEVR